jgi:hypothetical protein
MRTPDSEAGVSGWRPETPTGLSGYSVNTTTPALNYRYAMHKRIDRNNEV